MYNVYTKGSNIERENIRITLEIFSSSKSKTTSGQMSKKGSTKD